jgi:hypothetical protein
MKSLSSTATELETLINKVLPQYKLPYKNGRNVVIGTMLVRPSKKHGFVIIDRKNNSTVDVAFTKAGAIALAKCYDEDGNNNSQLKKYDQDANKHLCDTIFFRNIMNKSKDDDKIEIAETRFEISMMAFEQISNRLESYIMKV